jgi:outer membrane protein W
MKTTILSAALLATLTLPAFAGTEMAPKDMKDMKQMSQSEQSDAGFYVAAYGGAQFASSFGDNRQTATAVSTGTTNSTNSDINSFWGGVGGIKAGYNFNSFALGMMHLRLQPAIEADGAYIGNNNIHASNSFTPGGNFKASLNSGAFFVNGILRLKNSSIFTPYVGVGIGCEYITEHGEVRNPTAAATGLVTSDFDFAGEALFGIDVAVCKHISLFTEYKFVDAIGTDAKNSSIGGNGTYRFKPDQLQQNLITAGVKYTF